MIESFVIRNFKSILDLKVDFRYGEGTAPRHFEQSDTWAFLPTRNDKKGRFVPVMAIYGANASGKSNVINAFLTFVRILRRGVVGCYLPNKLNPKYADAGFQAIVTTAVGRFRYSLAYSESGISRESVTRLSETAKGDTEDVLYALSGESNSFAGIASPDYDAARLMQALRVECVNERGVQTRPFLPCLVRTFPGLTDFAAPLLFELTDRLQISNRNEFFISEAVDRLAKSDSAAAREEALAKIVRILRKFDFGVKGMTMNRQRIRKGDTNPSMRMREDGDSWVVDEIKLVHEDVSGKERTLDFMTEESDGTKVVAALIAVCLWALENGRTLFIDELDRSLHPFILNSLIRMFKSKRYNKTNAQLIFTAQDSTPLEEDLLRVSEIGIVNRTLENGTSFHRLCEFSDTRNVTNFRKQYLSGAYAGIPFPYI